MESKPVGRFVIETLRKAIQQDGECRLIAAGKTKPGLVPQGRTKEHQEAQGQCLDPSLNLFQVREVSEAKKPAYFVRLTREGIEALFENVPEGEWQGIYDAAAPQYKEEALDVCLALSGRRASQIASEREHLLRREETLLGAVRRMAVQRAEELRRERERVEGLSREVSRFQDSLKGVAEQPGPAPGPRKPYDELAPEVARESQRQICEELVYAWQDATESQTRTALERVMINAGLEPVGEPGETVPFDGRVHQTDDQLAAGDPVTVAEPGWRLESPRGSHLIVRARVKKQTAPLETPSHVGDDLH